MKDDLPTFGNLRNVESNIFPEIPPPSSIFGEISDHIHDDILKIDTNQLSSVHSILDEGGLDIFGKLITSSDFSELGQEEDLEKLLNNYGINSLIKNSAIVKKYIDNFKIKYGDYDFYDDVNKLNKLGWDSKEIRKLRHIYSNSKDIYSESNFIFHFLIDNQIIAPKSKYLYALLEKKIFNNIDTRGCTDISPKKHKSDTQIIIRKKDEKGYLKNEIYFDEKSSFKGDKIEYSNDNGNTWFKLGEYNNRTSDNDIIQNIQEYLNNTPLTLVQEKKILDIISIISSSDDYENLNCYIYNNLSNVGFNLSEIRKMLASGYFGTTHHLKSIGLTIKDIALTDSIMLSHGTGSGSLPGIINSGKIKPSGKLIKEGKIGFTGELNNGLTENGVSNFGVSLENRNIGSSDITYSKADFNLNEWSLKTSQFKIKDFKDKILQLESVGDNIIKNISRLQNMERNNGDDYYDKILKGFGFKDYEIKMIIRIIHFMKNNDEPVIINILQEIYKTKGVLDKKIEIENLRVGQFNNLSDQEKDFISNSFSVIFRIKNIPTEQLLETCSVSSSELLYEGEIDLKNIASIIVPYDKVIIIRKYLKNKGIIDIKVLPIEFIEGYKNGDAYNLNIYGNPKV